MHVDNRANEIYDFFELEKRTGLTVRCKRRTTAEQAVCACMVPLWASMRGAAMLAGSFYPVCPAWRYTVPI